MRNSLQLYIPYIPFAFKNARFEWVDFREGLDVVTAGRVIAFKVLQRRVSRKDAR